MSATNKPTFTQTRDPKPSKFQKDPNRSYLLVETTELEIHGSMLDEYANKLDAKGDDQYINHGYVPGACPSKRFELLSCSMDDYKAHLKKIDEETRRAMKSKDKGVDINERGNRPLSLNEIGERLPSA